MQVGHVTGTVEEQSPELTEFMAHLAAQDRDRAVVQVRELHLGGAQVTELVTGLLIPALRETGRRWFVGEWSVVEEHAATAIVDAALTAVSLHGPTMSTGPEVVVACAAGDWHGLAARCVAEILRFDGWRVTQAGPSLPPGQLAGFLEQLPDAMLVLSCAMDMFLPGAAEMIDVAHRQGVPVLVGGRGFGRDGSRARRLGADAWAREAAEVTAVLAALLAERAPLRVPVIVPSMLDEQQRLHRLRRTAVASVGTVIPGFDDDEGAEHLGLLLRTCESALLVADGSIVDDYLNWLVSYDTTRSRSAAHVGTMVAAVRAWLPPSFPETRRILAPRSAPSATAGQNLRHTDDAGGF